VSDFSAPVQAPPATRYFAVGGSEADGKVKFEVYRTAYGQQMRQTATYAPGEAVGSPEGRHYVDPISGEHSATKTQVDFATGCILVDATFDRVAGTGSMGRTAVRVTLLQPDGTLIVRSDATDSKDKQRMELVKQAKQAAQDLEQARIEGAGRSDRDMMTVY